MGSNIKITNELEEYINNHSYKLNPIQKEIIKYNETLGEKKKMQISLSQCHLLHLIIKLHNPKKILEIGTGSGYQTSILCFLKTDVYTIERNHNLFRSTTKLFNRLNINPVRFKYGDGYKGLIDDSPFDGILITAGSPNVPEDLLKQLKVGGRMVVPIGKKIQVMTKITRISINDFKKEFKL